MERIKLIVLVWACICVSCCHPLTIEELTPLLDTLKAGIKTEILSEIKSFTTELSNNVIATEEIVSAVQNQEEIIKDLTKELNETRLLLQNAKIDMAELEDCHNEIKAVIGNQSNVIELTQKEIKDTIEAQAIVVNYLKQDINETQDDIFQLENILNGLEAAIGNQTNQFNELSIDLKAIQENQENFQFVTIDYSKTLEGELPYISVMRVGSDNFGDPIFQKGLQN